MAAPKRLFELVFCFSCLLILIPCLPSGCNAGKGCLFADAASSHEIIQNRKVLYVLGGKKVVFNMDGPKKENGLEKWEEQRRIPAGPDPLHHNGSGPKKPRNSP